MVWEPKSIFLEQGWHSFHNYEGTLPTVTWNKSEVPALSLETFFYFFFLHYIQRWPN